MKISRSAIDPVVLSAIGILFPIWTVTWLWLNWTWPAFFAMLVTSWFMGIHITMFAHRAWCHRAWKPSTIVNWYGLIVFSLCLVGNSIGWVGIHREHHAHCDIIDPALVGFWIASIGLTVFKLHTINSLCHRTPWYLLPIRNDDTSSNSVLMVLLNINNGEAWHKNHHQNATNYRFSQYWYEIDPPARIIELLVHFKLASIDR